MSDKKKETKTTPKKKKATKTPVTKKETAKTKPTKKAETKVEETVEVKEEVVEETKTPRRKKTTQIELNEMICLRSVTKGGLTYISPKTGMEVTWDDYNTEEYIEYGEILTMKSSKPRFLTEPFVVIDDVEVAEKLGYQKMYDEMLDVDNLDSFYKSTIEEMEEQLEKSPKGIKRLIGDKAREQIKDGELVDIRKIKLLEDELKIELSVLID